jgi:hypothetical protein
VTCERVDFAALAGTAIAPFLGAPHAVWDLDDSMTGATPDVGHTLALFDDRRLELTVLHRTTYWGHFVELDVTVRGRWELLALDAERFGLRIHEPTYEVRAGDDAALRRDVETRDLHGRPDALWFEARA